MMRLYRRFICAAIASFAIAQILSGEDVLQQARVLAADDRRNEAIQLLEKHLAGSNDDVDARLLYGLILSWAQRYDDSRAQLRQVLATHPDYLDARIALINTELWSAQPREAERVAREGLAHEPAHPELTKGLARALQAQKRHDEAIALLSGTSGGAIRNAESNRMLRCLRSDTRRWEAAVENWYEWFDSGLDSWTETSVKLMRRITTGPVVARFSHAERFSLNSNQAEFEFHPSIRKGTYGFLEAAYSDDARLYPRFRVGGEVFQFVGGGFEISGGVRRLGFSDRMNLYTASFSSYQGHWLLSGRVYLTPHSPGASRSFQISTRRYFGETGDYLGLRLGHGSNAADIRGVTHLGVLNSTPLYAEVYKSVAERWRFGLRTGFVREERVNRGPLNRYLLASEAHIRF